MSHKVLPLQDIEEDQRSDDDNSSFDEYNRTIMEKAQFRINKGWITFKSNFTKENLTAASIYLLDTATFKLHISFDDLMMIMTAFVLFADDIRLLSAPKSTDSAFQTVYAICFFSFIFEFLLTLWAKTTVQKWYPLQYTGYFTSFFFWLDLIAIMSMLPDINWIAEGMGIGGINESVSDTNSNFSTAGRVVRTVRLVRLVRLYKIQSERARLKKQEEEEKELVKQGIITQLEIDQKKALNQERNSKVGAELSQTTTQRVIVIVLAMLCIIPVLNVSEVDRIQHYATRELHKFNMYGTNETQKVELEEFEDQFRYLGGSYYAVSLRFNNDDFVFYREALDKRMRSSAKSTELFEDEINGVYYRTEATFNNAYVVEETALNGILLTIFVSIVMLVGTVVFTNDVQSLVLDPIERMMNLVEEVAKHPLDPMNVSDEFTGEYETKLVEKTIEKMTGLLRIGFGEAGAGIISENLKSEDGTVNPLIPGCRMYAIFGFCDIHHFEDANEKLGGDIMTFVNTVAEIVHHNVHEWRGQSNKNLGQAFLLVWRIGDEETISDMVQGGPTKQTQVKTGKIKQNIDLRRVPGVDLLADSALVGYLKIIAELNRSKRILAYRSEPRLTDNGAKEFRISMGFGLHAGWAIEGAVGSIQKVDATYLSPHVNMAARLETSSKQYGVPLLASQNFYDLMSPEGQKKCRKLDVVTVKGSEFPIGIFTYDCLQDQEFVRKSKRLKSGDKIEFMKPENEMADVFEKDYDLLTLRKHVTPQFLSVFAAGIDSYLLGDWGVAKERLQEANKLMAEVPQMTGDGPSLTLLRYIDAHGGTAPASWKGFRPLTAK